MTDEQLEKCLFILGDLVIATGLGPDAGDVKRDLFRDSYHEAIADVINAPEDE